MLGSIDWSRYEPNPRGLDETRAAIARTEDIDPQRLVLTASTSEAYSLLFKVLADPGDVIALPRPSYPLLETLARLEGLKVVRYDLQYDGEWFIDPTSLTHAARTARAIVVVNPNNPTGSHINDADVELLRKLDLPVISDEVFAPYRLENESAPRIHHQGLRLAFSLGGFSKLLALPQSKLAWIGISGKPAEAREALARLEWVNDHYLSAGSPVQVGARTLLELGAPLRTRVQSRLTRNLRRLREYAEGSACTVRRVNGGWYATVHVPSTRTDEEWALLLLADHQVLVQPGYFYDYCGSEPLLVLSLLTEEAIFDEGVSRLMSRLEA